MQSLYWNNNLKSKFNQYIKWMWLKLLKFQKHNNLLNKLKLNRQIISNCLLMMSKCLNKNGLKEQNYHKNPPKLENNH